MRVLGPELASWRIDYIISMMIRLNGVLDVAGCIICCENSAHKYGDNDSTNCVWQYKRSYQFSRRDQIEELENSEHVPVLKLSLILQDHIVLKIYSFWAVI